MKQYETNCVNSTAELIEDMVDNATEITFAELVDEVGQEQLDEVFPMYKDIPLTLETDWSTSYYRSVYDGRPCVYVEHSRIEYIFT
jgi:hypothetical protein